jgi:hypothetical protein
MIVGDLRTKGGLAWEVQKILALGFLSKVVFVVPPLSDRKVQPRWQDLAALIHGKLPPFQGGELAAASSSDGTALIFRGAGKRWEKDYLNALLPEAAQWYTPRRKQLAPVAYDLLAYLFPVKTYDPWSDILAFFWFPVLFVSVALALAFLIRLPVSEQLKAWLSLTWIGGVVPARVDSRCI